MYTDYSIAGTYGADGNRAIGIVYRGKVNTPFGKDEVHVYIFGREKIDDYTNENGIYYIVIPKDISKYQLVYKSKGYWSQITEIPISNDHDPEKVVKITLEKMNPYDDSVNLKRLSSLLKTEERIYLATKSPIIRKTIKSDLEMLAYHFDRMSIGASATIHRTLDKMD
jgi:hypothetical protein